jgi:hypothetical protein
MWLSMYPAQTSLWGSVRLQDRDGLVGPQDHNGVDIFSSTIWTAAHTCGQVDFTICHPPNQHRPSLSPTQPLSNKGLEDYFLPLALKHG